MKLTKILQGVARFASRTTTPPKHQESKRPTSSTTNTGAATPRGGRPQSPAPATTNGKLQISYEPALDGDADPGEIVWAWIPFEDDPTQGKDRPCLVIGRLDGRLATVALTSKMSGPERDRYAVGTGTWDRERRPSYAKIDRIILLETKGVRREGAIFPKDRFDAVVSATAARKPDFQRA